MTFVKSHVDSLCGYQGFYAGARRCAGLEIPESRCVVVNRRGTRMEGISEKLFRGVGFAPRFYQKLRALDPQLVHAHFGTSALAALRISRKMKCPLIVTFHGRDATMTPAQARRSFRGRDLLRAKETIAREATSIIAVSKFIRGRLLEAGYPQEKIVLHYNGVDTSAFSPDASISREDSILFVGRLVEKKGCIYLLQAMERIREKRPDISAIILGDGPDSEELQSFSKQNRLNVEFLGFQPPEVVKSWMNRVKLLALPSVTARDGDSEGLPTVLLEAQSMGLPVVGTRHSGIPEALVEGQTGYLVDERDSESLADRLNTLLSNPERLISFGVNARAHVCDSFDLRRQTKKLESLYDLVTDEATKNVNFSALA